MDERARPIRPGSSGWLIFRDQEVQVWVCVRPRQSTLSAGAPVQG